MKFQSFRPRINRSQLLGFITVLTISLLWGSQIAFAQVDDASQPKVQELSGLLGKNTIAVYRLLDLKEGQQLYARMENVVVVTKDGAEIIDHFSSEMLVAGEI